MTKIIAIVKQTVKPSPDPCEWYTTDLAKSFDANEPISNVIEWAKSRYAELDTIKIRIDESEVSNG